MIQNAGGDGRYCHYPIVKTRSYYDFSLTLELFSPSFSHHEDSGSHDKFVRLLLHNSTRMAPWQLAGKIVPQLLISDMMCIFSSKRSVCIYVECLDLYKCMYYINAQFMFAQMLYIYMCVKIPYLYIYTHICTYIYVSIHIIIYIYVFKDYS